MGKRFLAAYHTAKNRTLELRESIMAKRLLAAYHTDKNRTVKLSIVLFCNAVTIV